MGSLLKYICLSTVVYLEDYQCTVEEGEGERGWSRSHNLCISLNQSQSRNLRISLRQSQSHNMKIYWGWIGIKLFKIRLHTLERNYCVNDGIAVKQVTNGRCVEKVFSLLFFCFSNFCFLFWKYHFKYFLLGEGFVICIKRKDSMKKISNILKSGESARNFSGSICCTTKRGEETGGMASRKGTWASIDLY